jgi:hypothetical protein
MVSCGQDLAPLSGVAPGGYERSPLSSFGGLDAECSLPASSVAARPDPDFDPDLTGVHQIGHWCDLIGYLSGKTPHLGKIRGEVSKGIA